VIEVEGLRKAFQPGTPPAVDNLGFRVPSGEVYGLLGPNGAGKTTTLRILATLLRPDAGRVRIDGRDPVTDSLGVRERIAWVPAEGGLPPRLTGREVVQLFARIQGVRDPDGAAERWLDRMGAAPFADRPTADLSTGMKRRVLLARALVHEPAALLLDEPTDGLDVGGRRDVLALVRALAAEGRAVVLSSHIMGEVERVVDRIGILVAGRMRAEGTVAEVRGTAERLDDAFVQLVEGE
jgi:sodium transport system ATP-binding protein